jgi:phage head maturation protease
MMKAEIPLGLSVGFKVVDAVWDEKRQGRRITKGTLLESSIVSVPANQDARTTAAKAVEWNPESERLRERLHTEVITPFYRGQPGREAGMADDIRRSRA